MLRGGTEPAHRETANEDTSKDGNEVADIHGHDSKHPIWIRLLGATNSRKITTALV